MWAGFSELFLTNRIWQKWHCIICESVIKSLSASPLVSLLDPWHWGKTAVMWEHSRSPLQRLTWQGAEATCQQPCEWIILAIDAQAPVRPSNYCSLCQYVDCTLVRIPCENHRIQALGEPIAEIWPTEQRD